METITGAIPQTIRRQPAIITLSINPFIVINLYPTDTGEAIHFCEIPVTAQRPIHSVTPSLPANSQRGPSAAPILSSICGCEDPRKPVSAPMRWSSLGMMLFLSVPVLVAQGNPDTSRPELTVTSPRDYQVVQRLRPESAMVPIKGLLSGFPTPVVLEVKTATEDWTPLPAHFEGASFEASLELPAGGWHEIHLRALKNGKELAAAKVAHVGVGEIFVVAGQSNSANHGQERQQTQTRRVSTFDGEHWKLAHDPQPGASGNGGSFIPPLGDRLSAALNVPIGFVACGIGATSVREWLPEGISFPNPPTIEARVRRRPDGTWESKGDAFRALTQRLRVLGKHGFRAILWHQGESDANQRDPKRTLEGPLYQGYLTQLITDLQKHIEWSPPWFVALVSYHSPDDTGSEDIRAAQAALWREGLAFQGPDSDALRGPLRDNNGRGVHFSGPGLRAHAKAWAEQLEPWLESQLSPAKAGE